MTTTFWVGEGHQYWFARSVQGEPEATITATLPEGVAVMGTLRLGLPYRDVDLFCLGVQAEGGEGLIPLTGIAHLGWLEVTTSRGTHYRLQKLGAITAEGRFCTLTANPPTWFRDQDREYGLAAALLQDPAAREEYLRLRSEGRKAEAYRTFLGIRYAEDRE